MSMVDIIIPTFNNWQYLSQCVQSIILHKSTPGLAHVIVVNNGHKESIPMKSEGEGTVLHQERNLGWEGGLKAGLAESKAPFVVFMNDDTYIPMASAFWLWHMLESFSDPKVAAVGPASNCVMGPQNVFIPQSKGVVYPANFLIGFCMMVRRSALDAVGGVDDSMPNHGDDLDLSIRFRKAGYKMLIDQRVFVYHHGFKTGQREHGAEWNSANMTEKTNHWLIRKHGLKEFWNCLAGPPPDPPHPLPDTHDSEGDAVRKYASGAVVEMGCGDVKTVPDSVGVDITEPGDLIEGLVGRRSTADIVADVSGPLPINDSTYDTVIARHILEHTIDPISVLREWGRILKHGGKLIIAVPDQGIRNTIPMNVQHVHGFTKESLKTLAETVGYKTESIEDTGNNVSILGVFTKNGLH